MYDIYPRSKKTTAPVGRGSPTPDNVGRGSTGRGSIGRGSNTSVESIVQPVIAEKKVETPPPAKIEAPKPSIVARPETNNKPFLELLNSPDWPEAVPKQSLCDPNSDDDKSERARNILMSMIDIPVKEKKVLDFGCGEGHFTKMAKDEKASVSVGYDIKPQGDKKWETTDDGYLLTADFEKVKQQGPYDIILAYDVVDHCENPAEIFSQIKQLTHKDSLIYVSCHPWASRHGGHLYQKVNKAFLHVFFSKEELGKMGLEIETNEVKTPSSYYDNLINESGFDVEDKHIKSDRIENFFLSPEFKEKVKSVFSNVDFPYWQMRHSLIDYKLSVTLGEVKPKKAEIVRFNFIGSLTGGAAVQPIIAYSDGTMSCNGKVHLFTFDRQKGDIIMKWADKSAPKGYWVDVCELQGDMQSWKGATQNGKPVHCVMVL